MQVNIGKLKSAWAIASRGSSNRPANPLLVNCRLTASNGRGVVQATDLTTWASGEFDCEGEIDCLLDSQRVGRYLSVLNDDDSVAISNGGNKVSVKAPSGGIEMPTANPEGFPSPDEIPRGVEMPCGALQVLLKRVAWGCDDVDGRNLGTSGISIVGVDGRLKAISTTGGRQLTSCRADIEFECGGILPPKFATNVASVLPADGSCRLSVTGNLASVVWMGGSLSTRLLDGDWTRASKWEQAIDSPVGEWLEIPAGIFKSIVERAAVMLTAEESAVRVVVEGGTLSVSSSTTVGDSDARHPVSYNGSENRLLDSRLILPMLRVIDSAAVLRIGFCDTDTLATQFRVGEDFVSYIAGMAE